ncbi:MAG: asparaginase domain-containing protein, partial [Pseudomonadota bacterium]
DDDASLRAGSDAPANLTLAAAVAARPIPGCRVAFGGQIMAATRIVKVSTVADAAFACPNGDAEPDALPQADRAALGAQLDALEQSLSSRSVLAYTPAPAPAGAHAAVLEATVEALGGALAGIHLMGFGGGNMPNAALLEPVLAKAQTQGVLLAAGTQVGAGPVSSAYASGCWLADAGAWPTGTRTPAAVQTKLALVAALGRHHGWGRTEMRHAFDGAFAAEA